VATRGTTLFAFALSLCMSVWCQSLSFGQPGARDARPVLVDFWSATCPWCIKQDQVLASDGLSALMAAFRYVKIDLARPLADDARALWQRVGRNAVPLLVVLTPDRKVAAVARGYQTAEKLRAFLDPFAAPPGPVGDARIVFPPTPPEPDRDAEIPLALTPPEPERPRPEWPSRAIGSWRLPNGRVATFRDDGGFELEGERSAMLAETRGGAYIARIDDRSYYKIIIEVISRSELTITFVIDNTGERRENTAVRVSEPDEDAGPDRGPDEDAGPARDPDEDQPPAPAPTGEWQYLREIDGDGDWYDRPSVSFRGRNYANSYRATYSGEGVWDLADFAKKGFDNPSAFTATFGVATDASLDASFQIEVWGNSRSLGEFVVTMDEPREYRVSIKGVYRLVVRFTKLSGSGRVLMVEPKVYFE